MAQWGIQLAVVAEPYYVPPRSDWAGDLDGSVAIIVRTAAACPPLAGVVKGQGYVAATIGEMVVLGGYFSPNRRLADFEGWIEEVGTVVARSRPRPVLVLGDFNAKSVAWGSPRVPTALRYGVFWNGCHEISSKPAVDDNSDIANARR
ncbi:hypothetical protein K1T71_002101 [Dendrolimus kikuchii]|uniref:Uncharacterized protein n=1 Tax=Dendrolimus kikuchii TaxID=765133 RepID=A0ACC1DFR3_9NEOP|nr:hypothetical protein K1T71_002101 [Dendrolimus kikuchii]